MHGPEPVRTRTRVAESVMPDGQELATPTGSAPAGMTGGPPGKTGPWPSGSLASRTDRPVVAGLVTLLAALAFTVARWQAWAGGSISRFILVGRHFATSAQLPQGMPLAPTSGYDGQFFYRLALNPLNFHQTAYGITMDQPYRYMRIGYPVLTWLASIGQTFLVPVMLVAVNITAIAETRARPSSPRWRR